MLTVARWRGAVVRRQAAARGTAARRRLRHTLPALAVELAEFALEVWSRSNEPRPTTVAICNSVGVREWLRRSRARTMERVLESHGPCESLELSIVQFGLETTEL